MVDHAPPDTPSPDPRGDGVRVIKRSSARRSSRLYKTLVMFLIGVCVVSGIALLWPKQSAHNATDDATASAGDGGPAVSTTMQGTTATQANSTRLAAPDDISNYIPPGEAPPMAEVIARLNKAGVHTGLGAFSPPGTSPPMVGLAVPEDFNLPEGYVRHYQATDDGQRIDPILMFSPDFEFFDAAGKPLTLPANMVVPPDMAPSGLPIRLIRIPPPLASQGSPA